VKEEIMAPIIPTGDDTQLSPNGFTGLAGDDGIDNLGNFPSVV
jgi:hypothetical protein